MNHFAHSWKKALAAMAGVLLIASPAHADYTRTITANAIWVAVVGVDGGIVNSYVCGGGSAMDCSLHGFTDPQGTYEVPSGSPRFYAVRSGGFSPKSFSATRSGGTIGTARRRAAADAAQGLFSQLNWEDVRVAACSAYNGHRVMPHVTYYVNLKRWGAIAWTGITEIFGGEGEYRAVEGSIPADKQWMQCRGTEWEGNPL